MIALADCEDSLRRSQGLQLHAGFNADLICEGIASPFLRHLAQAWQGEDRWAAGRNRASRGGPWTVGV